MDRIEEIKKRLRAASLGPWSRVKSLTSKYWTIGRIVSHAAIPSDNESDWDFIEHACEDIPYLLSEVERLGAIETNVRGIIPFLERHLQEILEVKDTPPDLKPAIRVGYLDCLGTLKDALFEAGLATSEREER